MVVATGDGAFGFNAMEIDTAVRHRARLLIVVANNGAWQIEVHDQVETHGKVVGTRLQFADHAAMARAFGMHAERVERVEDLDGAIASASRNLPALLDVVVTPEARSSDSQSGLRLGARSAGARRLGRGRTQLARRSRLNAAARPGDAPIHSQ